MTGVPESAISAAESSRCTRGPDLPHPSDRARRRGTPQVLYIAWLTNIAPDYATKISAGMLLYFTVQSILPTIIGWVVLAIVRRGRPLPRWRRRAGRRTRAGRRLTGSAAAGAGLAHPRDPGILWLDDDMSCAPSRVNRDVSPARAGGVRGVLTVADAPPQPGLATPTSSDASPRPSRSRPEAHSVPVPLTPPARTIDPRGQRFGAGVSPSSSPSRSSSAPVARGARRPEPRNRRRLGARYFLPGRPWPAVRGRPPARPDRARARVPAAVRPGARRHLHRRRRPLLPRRRDAARLAVRGRGRRAPDAARRDGICVGCRLSSSAGGSRRPSPLIGGESAAALTYGGPLRRPDA